MNTKIHAVVNARSQAIIIALSSGNEADTSFSRIAHGVPAKEFYPYLDKHMIAGPRTDSGRQRS